MELQLIEKTRKTRIKVPLKQLSVYKKLIDSYIALYGGKEEKRSSKYVYYIIEADLLNRKKESK